MPPPPALLLFASDGLRVPLAMLVVFASAKLLAELFERLGQPGLVGEILAGVLIGPGALAWIAPNEFLSALADLGVMFLLFRVGLEVKSSEMMRVGPIATWVAVCGVIVPFILGWGILLWWGAPSIEAIFVGAAMVATSVGITAQVLASQGLLDARASQIILAAAVIDDVLGLLVLAVVSNLARGQINVPGLVLTAVLAVGFTLVVALWGDRTLGAAARRLGTRMRAGEVQFNIAMLALFALSAIAAYVGVAAIVGAFLAGMALSETAGPRVRDLAQGVSELLVPFFLAGIGLHLNLSSLGDASTMLLAGVILVAAVASKFIGCGLGAWSLGRADVIRIGVGMIPRGEVGMVVAQIGLGLGVISQRVYSVVVVMAVATTLIAPPLLRLAFRGVPARPQPAGADFRID